MWRINNGLVDGEEVDVHGGKGWTILAFQVGETQETESDET